MNIITSICIVLIGLLISLILPKWIKFGSKSKRNKYRFYLNIVGVLVTLIGVLSLYYAIEELLYLISQ